MNALHPETEATPPLPHPGVHHRTRRVMVALLLHRTTQLDDLRLETDRVRDDLRAWLDPDPRPLVDRCRAYNRLRAYAGLAPARWTPGDGA